MRIAVPDQCEGSRGDKEIAGPSRESRPGTHMGETGQDFGHHGLHERGHGNDQRIQILQSMGITHDAAHIAQEDQDQFERQPIHASKTEPSPQALIGIGIPGHDRDAGAGLWVIVFRRDVVVVVKEIHTKA